MDVMLYVLLGLLAGLVAGWMAAKRSQKSALDQQASEHKAALDTLRDEMGRQQQLHADQLKSAQETARERESGLETSLQELRDQHQLARDQAIRLESELLPLKEKLNDRQKDLEETREALNTQFKVLSNSILDQQSTKFSEQNKKQIDGLLGPLKERITEFEKKVDEKYLGEAKDREGLKSQIQSLVEQSKRLEQEARDLTTALKGDNKTQGNWGELVLTRVLESSGLREGTDFVLQYTERDEGNSLKKPDVVVHLPDGKHIIVDAKVSLVAYEQFVNAPDDEAQQRAIKAHIESVRGHVKNLSSKDYPSLTGLNTPDMVLLFIPIEASFAVALEQDAGLFDFAWSNKIVIVTPSTLLATLKTVQSVWQHKRQIDNATAIAEEAGRMLDKFIGLADDLEKLGSQVFGTAKNTYDSAMKKLTGNGNLVKQATRLQEKGVRTKKELSATLLKSASNDETHDEA